MLTALAGAWTNGPSALQYQWEQGDGTTWLAVPGETGAAYAVSQDDVDLRLRVRVIAVNAGIRATASYPADRHRGRPAGGGRRDALARPGRGAQPRARAAADHARAGPRQAPRDDRLPVAGGRLRAAATRVRLVRGRYQLRLCTTAGGTRCARRTLTVARTSRARLPALSVGVPAGAAGRVSYTLRATRGVFSALTAKRPGPGSCSARSYGPSSTACENVPRSKNSSRGADATPWTSTS